MEKLCPICNENPLTGRQTICSSRCRSAQYRRNLKNDTPKRNTSQKAARQSPEQESSGIGSSLRKRQSHGNVDVQKWERSILSATERVVEAIREQHRSSQQQPASEPRIDIREQVESQTPKGAVGYRLVLPSRDTSVAPKFSPKRRRSGDSAWYSLTPFEYPDDIRLSDGNWYRIVWIDSKGERIRMKPGESVPGLRYFVGSAHMKQTASDLRSEHPNCKNPNTPTHLTAPLSGVDATNPQHTVDPPYVSASQGTASPSQTSAAPSQTTVAPSQIVASSTGTDPFSDVTNSVTSSASAELTAPTDTVDEDVPRLNITDADATEQVIAALYAESDIPPREPLVVLVPPSPEATTPPPGSWPQLLASYPRLSNDECAMATIFISQPKFLVQVDYEQRCEDALENGLPSPTAPGSLLSPEERNKVQELYRSQQMPPHFWALCKAIVAYVRQNGADVLPHLPIPMSPLLPDQRELVDNLMKTPAKRIYMQYVTNQLDALLDGQPLPVEPNVSLRPKERRQIIRAMQDLRNVLYFKKLTRRVAS